MFNININWLKIIKENTPTDYHSVWLFTWLKTLISPFNKIYQELLAAYQIFVLKIRFNGQIIYLEKILNDKFSPTFGGIYITDGVMVPRYYLYRSAELKPPRYLYSRWNSATNYLTGQFCAYQNQIWVAIANNTNSIPATGSVSWAYHKEVDFLRSRSEFFLTYNFIVMVPSSLVFNLSEMKGILDYYRLAGKHYKIQYY